MGYGGIAAVARAAGVSETTVAAGVSEVESGELEGAAAGPVAAAGRGAEEGGGDAGGVKAGAEGTGGRRPRAVIPWRRSPGARCRCGNWSGRWAALGFRCGQDAVARMLRAEGGYSLQAMAKVLEGKQHPGRDDQVPAHQRADRGVRGGRRAGGQRGREEEGAAGPFSPGRPVMAAQGRPVRVRDHDFPDEKLGKITPYGVYDIAANTGFVSVGASHDTGAFAVSALRLWWAARGQHPAIPARGGCWWSATQAAPTAAGRVLERPAGRPGGTGGPGDHRLPLPARHIEVEQDRAPAGLPHHPHLAGPAPDDEGRRRGRHRRDHHLPGPEVHRGPG